MNSSWWILGVISSTTLFLLFLILLVINQGLHSRRKMQDPRDNSQIGEILSTWRKRVFLLIVLQGILATLLSPWPGFETPFWLSFLLQGIIYASATLYYFSERDDF